MKPIKRIELIITHYKTNISSFEKKVGLSNNSIGAVIRRKTSVKDETLNSILHAYPDIDPTWLLIGEGNMLKSETSLQSNPNKMVLSDFSDLEITEYIAQNLNRFKSFATFRIVVGLKI
ncbi:hypothetical protein [Pseudozobellia sp. WGM2]|uniref:hypothetical protein n=1 Tax=Pseudozobellia sp. WGM2 TaxID=2787625 RepID=UPI001AE01259|nr:hypothetical protein [Pseudozobellia sp. WGM2]